MASSGHQEKTARQDPQDGRQGPQDGRQGPQDARQGPHGPQDPLDPFDSKEEFFQMDVWSLECDVWGLVAATSAELVANLHTRPHLQQFNSGS